MTQIVDKRLKKMCDECHSHLDKPCAWLSLGNEYCTEIMDIQQELQRKDNIINELKKMLEENKSNIAQALNLYDGKSYNGAIIDILEKIKELENK